MNHPSPRTLQALEAAMLARQGKWVNLQGTRQIRFLCPDPHHQEHTPSCEWNPAKMVWKCRSCPAGGGFKTLAFRLGVEVEMTDQPLAASKPKQERKSVLVRTYDYKLDGATYHKQRWEYPDEVNEDTGKPKKDFRWTPRFPDGVTVSSMPLFWFEDPAERPADPVVFVEGEKAVEACWQRGILATCGAWGASQRDFGESLQALRGRTVWLSPDNDAPGAEYMDAIAASLRGIATKVRKVRVALPPKGDLVEYFDGGGSVEALFDVGLEATSVSYEGPEHVRVRIPGDWGVVRFDAYAIERTRFAMECELSVAVEGSNLEPFGQRINLVSASAMTDLRRSLQALYDKLKLPWPTLVNEAVNAIRNAHRTQDLSVDVFDIPDQEEADTWFVRDLMPMNQPSMFFGDGSSLKSYLAALVSVATTLGEPVPGFRHTSSIGGRVLWLDYENTGQVAFRKRMKRLFGNFGLEVGPGIEFWSAFGRPLPYLADTIAEKVRRDNIRLLVVDSAGPACGGKPEDSDSAINYFNAIAKIGITSLTIAHINRDRDIHKPFGSAFWYNLSRRVWYVQRAGFEGSDAVQLGIYCRKVNDGPTPSPRAFEVNFTPDVVGWQQVGFGDVDISLDRLRPMPLRINDALRAGPLQIATIAAKLATKAEVVQGWLKRYPNEFVALQDENGGPTWFALRSTA